MIVLLIVVDIYSDREAGEGDADQPRNVAADDD